MKLLALETAGISGKNFTNNMKNLFIKNSRSLMAIMLMVLLMPTSLVVAQSKKTAEQKKKYNVLFILIDDMGWKDLSCYGSDFYESPNIDEFAESAMLFTSAYAASPLCSPTRASILTGQDPGRLRFTLPNGHERKEVLDPAETYTDAPHFRVATPQTRTRLPNDYLTFPEVLKENGYQTALMGKWHLGMAPYIPENQGFDVVVGGREQGWPPGPGYYFPPWNIETLPKAPEGTHIGDLVTDKAIDFIRENRSNPFLLCLWYYDVHGPFQTKKKYEEYYASKLSPEHIQRNPLMGGMVSVLDDNVGRVLNAVKDLELEDETIVIFTSDNGGDMYDYPNQKLPTYNYPLRSGKANNYEGGVRVPMIVRVPGMTKAGSISPVLTSSVDHYMSILELLNIPLPENFVTDGQSYIPALKGKKYQREPFYSTFYHNIPPTGNRPNISMREGPYKLYKFFYDGENLQHRYELYNIQEDIGEHHNLIEQKPKVFRKMAKQLEAYEKEVDLLQPQINKNYAGHTVGDWQGSDSTKISISQKVLHISATGIPEIKTVMVPMVEKDTIVLEFEMKSNGSGKGEVTYTQRVGKEVIKEKSLFEPAHNQDWQTYQVKLLLKGMLTDFSISPSTSAGQVSLRNLKLVSEEGYFIFDWPLY
ncbi:N-acetylgalactosamine-6-sulfatase [Flammeovirgaceae bacterium 311]|nr:N-acetylgalactosamine-6-sulfatase [Flammeovirgaceae bacterium 311]